MANVSAVLGGERSNLSIESLVFACRLRADAIHTRVGLAVTVCVASLASRAACCAHWSATINVTFAAVTNFVLVVRGGAAVGLSVGECYCCCGFASRRAAYAAGGVRVLVGGASITVVHGVVADTDATDDVTRVGVHHRV